MATKSDRNKAPAVKHTDVNPSHYRLTLKNRQGQTFECQAVDIIESIAAQDAHLGHALTYILRAGRKTKSSYVEDIAKAAWWCVRSVNFHGGHADIPACNLSGDLK